MTSNPSPESESLPATLLDWVRRNAELDSGSTEITYETDLLERSVLDSVGFIELLEFLEQKTGHQVDLMVVDPSELTSIRGLCQHVAKLGGKDA